MSMPRRISQKMGDMVDMLSNATVPTQMIRPPSDTDTDIDMGRNEIVHNDRPIQHYEPYTSWLCCTTYKDRSYFQNAMEHIDLSPIQKEIIQSRYLHILENFQKRTRNHSILFFIGHFIVTVGSLFVPALLSVQNSGSNYTFNITNFTVQIYWATFIISLMVTISNGILTLFNPSSTTYVKHFIATSNGMSDGVPPYSENRYIAGYGNTTSAINAIQFKFDAGNIDDGTILMYGIV